MLERIKRFFAPPTFDDAEKTQGARLPHVVLLTMFVISVVVQPIFTLVAIRTGDPSSTFAPIAAAVFALVSFGLNLLLRRGYVRASGGVTTALLLFLLSVSLVTNRGGISNPTVVFLGLVIVLAGLLVGGPWTLRFTGLTILSVSAIYYAETQGLLPGPPPAAPARAYDLLIIIIALSILGLLLRTATNHIAENNTRIRGANQKQAQANQELQDIRASLEERNEHLQASVKEYGDFMAEVGRGNLSTRLSVSGNGREASDPLIALGRRLNEMVSNLQATILQIRDAATSLSAQSAEILATTTQQATGATEQSAAVSQATTTVDEIKTIAEQLVTRSQTVASSAQRTVEVSRAGQEVSRETIAGMAQIKTRVDVIEENILALSERTQQIGGIIDTVNNIASQSNMLALNAAVEAARAGEQGKGFAVVAQEVRDLAERSTQATAQVKAILSNIQKATASTAMATEEGKKGVDTGVTLVEQMRNIIDQLAGVMDESAQSAMQMSAGGQQQTSGMEQIAVAMGNINQVTMQSMASTRQAERSAQELNELARSLSEVVEQYQV